MENNILKHLYCKLCKLQFGKKVVYDMHQSLVHKEDIKEEPSISDDPKIIMKDFFCELCKLQFNKKAVYDMHQSLVHNKTQEIKDSGDEDISEKEQDKTEDLLDSDENIISEKEQMEENVDEGYIATIHKGKKPFNCSIRDQTFSRKSIMSHHIAIVHGGKKSFK